MTAALVTRTEQPSEPFLFSPTNFGELMKFSEMAANSSFVSEKMRGKPGDVLMAIQMGAEVGLNPLQAIQNIAVINSRPCLWGDAALAVVMKSNQYEYHKEWMTGTIEAGDRTAHCLVKRKGAEEHTVPFSIDDAKRANLWKKNSVWTQYPDRMLQMRARAFSIRDKFADALKGLSVAEEVQDYNTEPKRQHVSVVVEPVVRHDLIAVVERADTLESLKNAFEIAYRAHDGQPDVQQQIVELKDARKTQMVTDIEFFKQELATAEDGA